ncbi:hypothetical protein AAKU55_002024 [Oxalobacteraceae bacterium GrIS 1.11]
MRRDRLFELKVNNVASVSSISSINSAQAGIAFAQQKVQQDQSQVQADDARLAQSQLQLNTDQQQLSQTQQQGKSAPQAVAPANVDRAIAAPVTPQKPLPAALAAPQLNTQGQTIGTRINVTA